MKYLLDTHILIWSLTDDPKLSAPARQIINDAKNHIFYSTVSIWEVAIKHRLHPLKIPCSGRDLLDYCKISDISNIPLFDSHVSIMDKLLADGNDTFHKDPFDRLMLAQAIAEDMTFMTHDKRIAEYLTPNIYKV